MTDALPLAVGGPRVAITGSPVSGKSQIARALATALEVPYFSAGDIVRRLAGEWPDLAQALSEGATIDSPRIDNAIIAELEGSTHGWVIDGFPRFVPQYLKLMAEEHTAPALLMWVETTLDLAVAWGKQRGRVDDTPENIKKRWAWFNSQVRHVFCYAHSTRQVQVMNYFNIVDGNLPVILNEVVKAMVSTVTPSRIFRPGGVGGAGGSALPFQRPR